MQLTTNKIIKIAVISALAIPSSVFAGGITYKDGDNYLKVGGRIQLQYHQVKPDGGSTTDEIFFRRLRPYIEGSTHHGTVHQSVQTGLSKNMISKFN